MKLISQTEFTELFASAGLGLTPEMYRKFALYAEILAEKNAVMNLTAITEPRQVAEKHFLDSCLPLRFFDPPQNASLVDVGAGAGFPSVPLCIMREDIRPTMIDSLNKRVVFLEALTSALGIGAQCIHARAEDSGRGDLRESFDVAVARAVSRLSILSEYCLPLIKPGGAFLALKGGDCGDELESAQGIIRILGGKVENTVNYSLPSGDRRTLITVRKIASTPASYPRSQGKIKASAER